MRTGLGAAPSGPAHDCRSPCGPRTTDTVEVLPTRATRSASPRGPTGTTEVSASWGPGTALPLRPRRRSRAAGPRLAVPAATGCTGPPKWSTSPTPGTSRHSVPDHSANGCSTSCISARSASEGTFAGSGRQHSTDLVELGVTAVEIMPVAQFPGRRNWGYDGVFPSPCSTPTAEPAGPARVRRRVPPARPGRRPRCRLQPSRARGKCPRRRSRPYFTDRYQTPWGPAVNLDGPYSDEVRALLPRQRPAVVRGLPHRRASGSTPSTSSSTAARGRSWPSWLRRRRNWPTVSGAPACLIAESADNNPLRRCARSSATDSACDAQWNDDFHHSVHAVLTGERDGYYLDYGRADDVARAMDQGFVYQGQYSAFRRRRHGAPVDRRPSGALRDLRPEP